MNESKRFEQPRGARFIVPLRFIGAAVVFFAAFIFVAQTGFGQSNSESGIAQRHAQHLRHGINLSEWFAQVYDAKGYTKEHFETWNTAQDIALIKAMGFDHVRLSVNPQPMFRRGQADRIPEDYLGYLDVTVQMILARGLAAIIDVHPESDFKQKLAADDSFVEQFADYWRGLARHYSSTNPDLVSFEILNEPEFHDRYRWPGVQAKLAAAMLPDAVNRLQAIHYGLDRWNAARIDGEIGQVAAWAKRWNVPVTCNEFGVYRKAANPQDRAAWISDVRTTLEKYGIGWTMWDYSGGFGVVTKQEGHPAVPDALTVKALGMKMPPMPQ